MVVGRVAAILLVLGCTFVFSSELTDLDRHNNTATTLTLDLLNVNATAVFSKRNAEWGPKVCPIYTKTLRPTTTVTKHAYPEYVTHPTKTVLLTNYLPSTSQRETVYTDVYTEYKIVTETVNKKIVQTKAVTITVTDTSTVLKHFQIPNTETVMQPSSVDLHTTEVTFVTTYTIKTITQSVTLATPTKTKTKTNTLYTTVTTHVKDTTVIVPKSIITATVTTRVLYPALQSVISETTVYTSIGNYDGTYAKSMYNTNIVNTTTTKTSYQTSTVNENLTLTSTTTKSETYTSSNIQTSTTTMLFVTTTTTTPTTVVYKPTTAVATSTVYNATKAVTETVTSYTSTVTATVYNTIQPEATTATVIQTC